MPEYAPLDLPDNPKLAGNITHFARALRKAGLPIGTGRIIDAIRAVEVGFHRKTRLLLDPAGLLCGASGTSVGVRAGVSALLA